MFPLQPLQEATPIRWAGGGVPLSPRGTSRRSKDGDHSVAIEQYTLACSYLRSWQNLKVIEKRRPRACMWRHCLCAATLTKQTANLKSRSLTTTWRLNYDPKMSRLTWVATTFTKAWEGAGGPSRVGKRLSLKPR